MRTDAIVALQVSIGLLYSSQRGGRADGSLALGVCIAEFLLTSLFFRNTVLSSLVLPSQLTSRPPAAGLCGTAIRFVLSKVNGGAHFEPWQEAEDVKKSFVAALEASSARAGWEEFTVSAVDGASLSAAAYTSPGAASRWIVFVPPNGQQWESVVFSVARQAAALSANFLVFNYRGVGRSSGVAQTSAELVLDCEAALDWLMVGARSVHADQILLHGHSLGGGVGLQVLRRRAERGEPPIAMIHDRSFTSVAQVVARHAFVRRDAGTAGPALLCGGFGGMLGGLALLLVSPASAGRPHGVIRLATAAALGHGLGEFLAKHLLQLDKPPEDWGDVAQKFWEPYLSNHSVYAIGSGFGWLSITTALGMGVPASMIGTVEWLTASCFAGAVVGMKTDVLQQAAPFIIKALGWDMDSLAAWRALCEAHTANATGAPATAFMAGSRNQTGSVDASDQPVVSGAGTGASEVDAGANMGRGDMSIGAAVGKGLSNANFDLSENLRRGDQRQVDPAIFVMERIMAEQGCDFDTARLIYNQRKMIEAGVDPETGLALDIEQAEATGSGWCETPPVLVVYHQADGMIPYRFASLAAAMKQHGAYKLGGILYDPIGVPRAREMFELKLRGEDVNSHMYPLWTHPQEWAELVTVVKRLLGE